MHYKVREVGEVDNRTLHRGFDMPGRSNAFTLMATNAPSCFPKELREIMGRCRSAWDFTSDCYFTASNNLDQGSVVNRFGEPLKTCVIIEASTAIECFKTPYLLADDIMESAQSIVDNWNFKYSSSDFKGVRGTPGAEIPLAQRSWVDKQGKHHKTELVVILDTFRFVREIMMDEEVGFKLKWPANFIQLHIFYRPAWMKKTLTFF